ncbi:MAG TPA: hypothetical protein VLC55_07835 [Burkholderiales bacterium]|nr:hypothetical protein [Burkholderiales bacterium]
MPYYVYRILSFRRLEKVDAFPSYKEASSRMRALRREAGPDAGFTARMIFADNELAAEDLLSQERPPEGFVGDDY